MAAPLESRLLEPAEEDEVVYTPAPSSLVYKLKLTIGAALLAGVGLAVAKLIPAPAASSVDPTDHAVIFANKCPEERWVKLDKKTTPPFAIAAFGGSHNKRLKPGQEIVVQMPPKPWKASLHMDAHSHLPYWKEPWYSGTGWVAQGCDSTGEHCKFGDTAAKNTLFEWTFEPMPTTWQGLGKGAELQVTFDVSNVNSYTQAMAILPYNYWPGDPNCSNVVCDFQAETNCPDGQTETTEVAAGSPLTTCLGGCDYCLKQVKDKFCGGPDCDECRYICCPAPIDSKHCLSMGKQQNTPYAKAMNAACPHSYAFSYDDKRSTMHCFGPKVGLRVELCPDYVPPPPHPCMGQGLGQEICTAGIAAGVTLGPALLILACIALKDRIRGGPLAWQSRTSSRQGDEMRETGTDEMSRALQSAASVYDASLYGDEDEDGDI